MLERGASLLERPGSAHAGVEPTAAPIAVGTRNLAIQGERAARHAPTSLTVRELRFRSADRDLLNGIDLDLASDGITMIMGPNGAGKSLLLRLLHGLLAATDGTIQWGATPVGAQTRAQQAMVFQRPVLLRRSVAANLDFVLRERGADRTERRDAWLARVGLLERGRQPARLLSGGEQQRLALARALATEPRVLFLDEPTASLDPASTAMIEEIVREASLAGTKILFVTHDAGQARRIADDVVFLANGRVAEHTVATAFFDQPKSSSAEAYLAGRLIT